MVDHDFEDSLFCESIESAEKPINHMNDFVNHHRKIKSNLCSATYVQNQLASLSHSGMSKNWFTLNSEKKKNVYEDDLSNATLVIRKGMRDLKMMTYSGPE